MNKTIKIELPPSISAPSIREMHFKKEYQLSGIISSLNWAGPNFQHFLGTEKIQWLGAQSGGADFKGISWDGRLVSCEVKKEFENDLTSIFAQTLKGAQQTITFLKNNQLAFKPKGCDLFFIFPGNEQIKDTRIKFSQIREFAEKKYTDLIEKIEKKDVINLISNLDIRLHSVGLNVVFKENYFEITSKYQSIEIIK